MGFKFPYQKIVNLKKNEKTQAEWLLARALENVKEEERSLEALLDRQQGQFARLSQASEQSAPIYEIRMIQGYIEALEKRIEGKRRDLERARRDAEEKQRALVEKMREEKIWMKAREKAVAKFSAALLKREQNEIDEIAGMRHIAER